MEKFKSYASIAVFAAIILGLSLWHFVSPDKSISLSERRQLASAPEISAKAIFSGEFTEELESYMLDQFPMRDAFRAVKAVTQFYLLRQSDNNGIYIYDGSVCKMEYPLDEKQLSLAADKFNSIYEQYLEGMDVYYSIIPDKNYYAAEKSGHIHIDYDSLVSYMNENVENMEYIDIFPELELDSYYSTDSHWRQERIYGVARILAHRMGMSDYIIRGDNYESHSLEPFYGVYWGQSALPVQPDVLTYQTNGYIESAVVTGIEFEGERPVYNTELFPGTDGYDVFLSGAQAVLTIECPNAGSDKELIIFRDSFGSSIAPYFIGTYARITLIDLRYISSGLLPQFVEFEDQDVLFLYSTLLLNNAGILK